jgi:hypothetical protein
MHCNGGGFHKTPCQTLEEKNNVAPMAWTLQGLVRDRLFAFVEFRAFGYHILKICVLAMLSSS